MKKQTLYIVAVVVALLIAADVAYVLIDRLTELATFPSVVKTVRTLGWALVLAGWCVIVYKIIKRKYNWLKK